MGGIPAADNFSKFGMAFSNILNKGEKKGKKKKKKFKPFRNNRTRRKR
jgi:hypothetical protein